MNYQLLGYEFGNLEIFSFLVGFIFGWTCWLNFLKARKYRRLWIDKANELIKSRKECGEWEKTAWTANEARAKRDTQVAGLRRQVTQQAESIDSLMHGDAICISNHRHYKTQGVNCPHCGAGRGLSSEALTLATQYVCKTCYMPTEALMDGVCPQCADIATRF